ncbi:hypothetical protein ACNS7O_00875 [Haloferacaceae archaeon DSL9]
MSESATYSKYVKPVIRFAVVFLVAFSIIGSYTLITERGATPGVLADVVVNLYIAALVFYGVFWDAMNTRRFRIALYLGIAGWGVSGFIAGSETAITYVLVLGGGVLLVRELFLN